MGERPSSRRLGLATASDTEAPWAHDRNTIGQARNEARNRHEARHWRDQGAARTPRPDPTLEIESVEPNRAGVSAAFRKGRVSSFARGC
jgi:hypothetical protein